MLSVQNIVSIFMSDTYTTTNFYLAAFLCASGVVFVSGERLADTRQTAFHFEESMKRKELSSAFLVGEEVEVNVHAFIAQLKRLKSIIHDG